MERTSKIIKKLIHHSLTVSFMLGFIVDSIFLPEAESVHTREIGFFYLVTVSLSILIREYIISRNRATQTEAKMHSVFSYLIAFFSGSLLSFVFIYFFRSASLYTSWPLFLILAIVILLNEFFTSHSFRFLLDIAILFASTTFFVLFMFPIYLKQQSDQIFFVSIGISFIFSLLYINILRGFSETLRDLTSDAYKMSLAVPAVIVTFYLLNIVPPVPLSTKSSAVYHSVTRNSDGSYFVASEEDKKFPFLKTKEFHYTDGENVYFFNAISAPSELRAELSHVWEKYDPSTNSWKLVADIPFSIIGGRDGGYRSYSKLENLSDGEWRVSAKVGDRRTVGRVYFNMIYTDTQVKLIEKKI